MAPAGIEGEKAAFYSDGNDDYTYVLPRFFHPGILEYGQLVKVREGGRVVGKIKRKVYGNPAEDEIETTDIENFNGILRERLGRLVRRTKCHSKLKSRLESALEFFQLYWNFMHPLGQETPAMMEGLAERPMSWREFFYFRINYS